MKATGQAVYPKFRRRHYIVNRGLQSRFIIGFSLAVFVGILVNLIVVYFMIDRELAAELYRIHLRVRTTSEIAWPILWKLSAVVIPAILVAAFFIGRVLTRRVETPLADILEAVRRTSQGDLTQALEKDRLEQMPETFNRMSAALHGGLGAIKGVSKALDRAAGELEGLYGKGEHPGKADLERVLEKISSKRAEAEKAVLMFKV